MIRRYLLAGLGFGVILCFVSGALFVASVDALEKLKIGSSVKLSPIYYLPITAGQEKGIWKKKGLAVEWVPFRGGSALNRAVAAKIINIGLSSTATPVQGAARGVPALIVSELAAKDPWYVWVRADSRIKQGKDMKAAKIGVTRFGGTSHAYARAVAKSLELEKEIKFVAAGGLRAALAGLKTAGFDAVVQPLHIMIGFKLKREVREILSLQDHLPAAWLEHIVFARRAFAQDSPDTVKKVVQGVLQAIAAIRKDPGWSREKMKAISRMSEQGSRIIYQHVDNAFTKDGKIDPNSLENMRNFLINYGIISKEKAPPVRSLYTTRFIP